MASSINPLVWTKSIILSVYRSIISKDISELWHARRTAQSHSDQKFLINASNTTTFSCSETVWSIFNRYLIFALRRIF